MLVLAPYRDKEWVQRILVSAALNTFNEYLPPSFFHDIFGRVIPLDEETLINTRHPAEVAAVRREWRDQFVKFIPEALQWSGLLCVQTQIKSYQWWSDVAEFEIDMITGMWPAPDGKPHPYILMLRRFESVEEETPLTVILHRLSKVQQKLFNILPVHVGGMTTLKWKVRVVPDWAKPGAKPEHERLRTLRASGGV